MLPTLAEAESWAVATRGNCAEVAGGRATLKAAMTLVDRVVALCCEGNGQVTKRGEKQTLQGM